MQDERLRQPVQLGLTLQESLPEVALDAEAKRRLHELLVELLVRAAVRSTGEREKADESE